MQQLGPLKERIFYPIFFFFLPKEKVSYTYKKIINFSNEKISYTCLKKLIYAYPKIINFTHKKLSYICQKKTKFVIFTQKTISQTKISYT